MFLQSRLQNDLVTLVPLHADDFEELYQVAADPLIWEQHPNPDRYKREVFKTFFEGAILSKGAFKILELNTNKVIGCTRYYDLDITKKHVFIGYTFFDRNHWGTTYNRQAKILMLNNAFKFVDKVYFHIGAQNTRSQIAIGRLGAQKVKEIEVSYFSEPSKLNFEYLITKEYWYS